LRDRDAKFARSFDDVFRSEGAEVLRTPVRAPRANAYAERWVRTVRAECLDWLLIVGRAHLERALRVYVKHYTVATPAASSTPSSPDSCMSSCSWQLPGQPPSHHSRSPWILDTVTPWAVWV